VKFDPAIQRIRFSDLVRAVPSLHEQDQRHIADGLEQAAEAFCTALADHRRSPAFRGRLVPPIALGLDALLEELHGAADVLGRGDESARERSVLTRELARRLEELAHPAGPHPMLVVVGVEASGRGELLLSRSLRTDPPDPIPPGTPDPDAIVVFP
jgi:hypothetical protein